MVNGSKYGERKGEFSWGCEGGVSAAGCKSHGVVGGRTKVVWLAGVDVLEWWSKSVGAVVGVARARALRR